MTVHAPYNFVPLSGQVVLPDWSGIVSHDVPLKDGLSGSFEITVVNDTEILIGDGAARPKSHAGGIHDVRPFRLPDGRAAIPGSSLRGMIRSVLEIATFSRFRQVDDSRFGVRDLTAAAKHFYRDEMAPDDQATARAGWLSFRDGRWEVQRCEYVRAAHDDLAGLASDDWWKRVPGMAAGSARKKYMHWPADRSDLKVWFKRALDGIRATDLSLSPKHGHIEGTLVFTGQPATRSREPNSRTKKSEFIFFAPGEAVTISDDVMRGFLFIHEESDHWDYLRNRPRIPVFYIERETGIASLGLALMFKLAYKHTVHDLVPKKDLHFGDGAPDFCDLVFGKIDKAADGSLKARAWFEPAVSDTATMSAPLTRVLSNPKPTFYPAYIRQKHNDGNLEGPYTSWSDRRALVRGWKRYPTRTVLNEGHAATEAVTSRLHPIQRGTPFRGRVVFHNLRREELGALLWALTWGGEASLRHGLGMGKPYGLGAVHIEISNPPDGSIVWNDPNRKDEVRIGELIEAFRTYMSTEVPSWSETPQIIALRAMADPSNAPRVNLDYMKLEPRGDNEFLRAKNARPPQVLPEFPGVPSVESHAAAAPAPMARRVAVEHRHPVQPVVPAPPARQPWPDVEVTLTRDGGAEILRVQDSGRVATEKLEKLKNFVTPDALRVLRKGKTVRADVTVELIGGKRYRLCEIVFRS